MFSQPPLRQPSFGNSVPLSSTGYAHSPFVLHPSLPPFRPPRPALPLPPGRSGAAGTGVRHYRLTTTTTARSDQPKTLSSLSSSRPNYYAHRSAAHHTPTRLVIVKTARATPLPPFQATPSPPYTTGTMPVIAAPARFPRGPYRPPPVDPPYEARLDTDDPLVLEDPYLHPHFAKAYRRPPSPIADGSYIPSPRAPGMERGRSRSQERRIERSRTHTTTTSSHARSRSVPPVAAQAPSTGLSHHRHPRDTSSVRSHASPSPSSLASTPSASRTPRTSSSSSRPHSPVTPATSHATHVVIPPTSSGIGSAPTTPAAPTRPKPQSQGSKGKLKRDKHASPEGPKREISYIASPPLPPAGRRRFWPFGRGGKRTQAAPPQVLTPPLLGDGTDGTETSRFSRIDPTPPSARSSYVLVSPPVQSIPLVPEDSRPPSLALTHPDARDGASAVHGAPSINSLHSQQPSSVVGHQAGASTSRLVNMDKIDEIDETDPYGLRWHNSGPYDAIGSVLGSKLGSQVGSPMLHTKRAPPSIGGSSVYHLHPNGAPDAQHSRATSRGSNYPSFIPESLPPPVPKLYSSGPRGAELRHPERSGTMSTAPLQDPGDQTPIEPQEAHHAPRSRGDMMEPSGDTFLSNSTHISNPRSFEREVVAESARRSHSRNPSGGSARSASSGAHALPVPPPGSSRHTRSGDYGAPPLEHGYSRSTGRYSPSQGRGSYGAPDGHYAHSQDGDHYSQGRHSPAGSFFQAGAPPPPGHPPEDHYYARGELDHPPAGGDPQQWHHDRESQQFYDDGPGGDGNGSPPRSLRSAHHHHHPDDDMGSPHVRAPSQYTQGGGSYYEPEPGAPMHQSPSHLSPHAPMHGSPYAHDGGGGSESGLVYDPREHRYVPRSGPGSVMSGGSRGGPPPPRHLPRTLVMPASLQGHRGPPSVASSGQYHRGRAYEQSAFAPAYPRDPSRPRSPGYVVDGRAGRLKKKR